MCIFILNCVLGKNILISGLQNDGLQIGTIFEDSSNSHTINLQNTLYLHCIFNLDSHVCQATVNISAKNKILGARAIA